MKMNNCEIEIDFLRQSFRVIRNPAALHTRESHTPSLSPFLGNKRPDYITETPPLRRGNTVDKVCFVKKRGERNNKHDIVAGGIFTSIRIPLQPENNFERIFNEMLPDLKSTKRRCFCHRRPKPDVDVEKMLHELMYNLCKSAVPKIIETPPTAKRNMFAFQNTKSKSVTSLLSEGSPFWIGSEYRYNAGMDTLLLKFLLLGTPPQHTRKLFVDVRVTGIKKNKVRRVELKKSAPKGIIMGQEISVQMISLQTTLEKRVHVQLATKKGFLRITKQIDEWEFPLYDCNCMYQRSYWRNV